MATTASTQSVTHHDCEQHREPKSQRGTVEMAEVSADNSARLPYDQVLVDIVDYVFHYEVTSPRAWERAKIALFDALGCAFETLTESREARDLIGPAVEGTFVPNGFKLPGTSLELDPVKGAFDLGSLIRYLDHSDAFPGAEWGHPSGKADDKHPQLGLC